MIIPVFIVEGRLGAALLCYSELFTGKLLLQFAGIRLLNVFISCVLKSAVSSGCARPWRTTVTTAAATKSAPKITANLVEDIIQFLV